jgi:hypothetical protein
VIWRVLRNLDFSNSPAVNSSQLVRTSLWPSTNSTSHAQWPAQDSTDTTPGDACPSLPLVYSHTPTARPIHCLTCKTPPTNRLRTCTNTHTHSTERNQELSPLLRLPGEIRNRIFFYAIGNDTLPIPSDHTPPDLSKGRILSKVCRQLHAETRLLPYAVNDLCFVTIPSFVAWSRRAPQEVRAVVRCIMFEYISRPQGLPKYVGAFLALKKVKIKPGRPRGRQELEAVMSKSGIKWEIVEEEEPWGQQQRVVPLPFVFVSRPAVAALVVSTSMCTTLMVPMVPMVTTPPITTPPAITPPVPTPNQLPPTMAHVCSCRSVNRDLQPLLHRLISRRCSCKSTRIADASIEENIDTLVETMQALQII